MFIDPTIPAAANCRHCGRGVAHLPPSAMYCPACGGALVPTGVDALKARVREVRGQTLRCAMSLIGIRSRSRMGALSGDPDRSKIITGYGNAMFKLGWRYERHRNLPEASRCYFKSSKLGNADAAVRLAPTEAAAKDQLESLESPVPAFRMWRDWEAARETIEQRIARDRAIAEATARLFQCDKDDGQSPPRV